MSITFGNTWWGQQWLGALNRIDFSSRLPRGKSYANKGAVTSIKIKGNQIEAKVQGTLKKPYKVNIIVPPYYEEHTSVFLEAIKNNPLVLAKLLNRELPKELMDIANESGIKIFPESWQDIKLNCSCPDWAVPCKHLAAVIYIIANEIDKNPFMVFKLHNFDILDHFKDVESNQKAGENQPVFNLFKAAVANRRSSEEFLPDKESLDALDFSIIPNIEKQIVSLYPSKTLFYNGDFSLLLASHYKKKIKSFRNQSDEWNTDISAFSPVRNSRLSVFYLKIGKQEILYQHPQGAQGKISLLNLVSILNQTSAKHIGNYSPDFSALYHIFHYCKRLVTQGAVLPQLIETNNNDYQIRWTPALIDKEVKIVFNLLLSTTPPDICCIVDENKEKSNKKFLSPEENLKTLCTLFLDFFFKSSDLSDYRLGNESAVSHNEKVAKLFFLSEKQSFDAFTEKEIPNSIQLWLNRFNIARKDFAPVLAIDEFEDHFECNVLVENKEKPFEAPMPLSRFLTDQFQPSKQLDLIKDLAMLVEHFPELEDVIRCSGQKVIRFDNVTVVEILQKTLPALELFGIRIMLPKSLQQILKPQISMKINSKKLKSYLSLDEILTFDWRVALGNNLITEDEFKELAKNAGKLIRIKDNYALMTEDEIKKIIKALSSTRDVSSLKLLQSVLSEDYEGAKVEIDNGLRKEIQKLLKEDETPLPQGLQATLRPYQLRGFNWMYKNARLGFGSLLADDMGLGKTLQVITTLLKFKEEGHLKDQPALVIVPTTLLTNWEREIYKFAPDLKTMIFHGTGRRFDSKAICKTDVLLTTYGIARSEAENFKKIKWHTVVIDEAQNIKNSETAQSKAIKQLKSKIKIAMSGTPVENRLSEYWSIFDFSNVGYLGNLSFFTEHFAKPIELNKDKKCLENFKKITQPFVLRREKNDKSIITDLPDKIENNQYCELSPAQASLYNETVTKSLQNVENSDGMERQGLVLKLLSSLKQICNHPSQYLKIRDFSPLLSGKMEMLFQLLDNIYEAGEKTLIFSQYAEMGSMLTEMIFERYGKKTLFLHGGCSRKQRDEMVSDFQHCPDADTFVLSLKAGGTGLNLTAAANVIHYDLWWNPAVEAQATDRAFRIGQQKNVMVHRFITKNTLEEKIDAMMQSKKELANLTIAKGESWIGNLNDKDLKDLIMFGNS